MSTTLVLHNIGGHRSSNYNTLEEVLLSDGLLTFDGVYRNIYDNRRALKGREAILFVTGDYIGKDNTFDKGQPFEQFCTYRELKDLQKMGFELQWHTWSHRDLTKLDTKDIIKELTQPFGYTKIAYPYGNYNAEVLAIAKDLGYTHGYSTTQGDGNSNLTIPRQYL